MKVEGPYGALLQSDQEGRAMPLFFQAVGQHSGKITYQRSL